MRQPREPSSGGRIESASPRGFAPDRVERGNQLHSSNSNHFDEARPDFHTSSLRPMHPATTTGSEARKSFIRKAVCSSSGA
jgi:hypothetical protein